MSLALCSAASSKKGIKSWQGRRSSSNHTEALRADSNVSRLHGHADNEDPLSSTGPP